MENRVNIEALRMQALIENAAIIHLDKETGDRFNDEGKYTNMPLKKCFIIEHRNKQSISEMLGGPLKELPDEYRGMQGSINGHQLQLIGVKDGEKYTHFIHLLNGIEVTTLQEKQTGKYYTLVDDNYAMSIGFKNAVELMANDEEMDFQIKLKTETGYWQVIPADDGNIDLKHLGKI